MNWYGISALQTVGLAWDVKLTKIKPNAKPKELAEAVVPAVPLEQVEELEPAMVGD
jgi:hypothetical protein